MLKEYDVVVVGGRCCNTKTREWQTLSHHGGLQHEYFEFPGCAQGNSGLQLELTRSVRYLRSDIEIWYLNPMRCLHFLLWYSMKCCTLHSLLPGLFQLEGVYRLVYFDRSISLIRLIDQSKQTNGDLGASPFGASLPLLCFLLCRMQLLRQNHNFYMCVQKNDHYLIFTQ